MLDFPKSSQNVLTSKADSAKVAFVMHALFNLFVEMVPREIIGLEPTEASRMEGDTYQT